MVATQAEGLVICLKEVFNMEDISSGSHIPKEEMNTPLVARPRSKRAMVLGASMGSRRILVAVIGKPRVDVDKSMDPNNRRTDDRKSDTEARVMATGNSLYLIIMRSLFAVTKSIPDMVNAVNMDRSIESTMIITLVDRFAMMMLTINAVDMVDMVSLPTVVMGLDKPMPSSNMVGSSDHMVKVRRMGAKDNPDMIIKVMDTTTAKEFVEMMMAMVGESTEDMEEEGTKRIPMQGIITTRRLVEGTERILMQGVVTTKRLVEDMVKVPAVHMVQRAVGIGITTRGDLNR